MIKKTYITLAVLILIFGTWFLMSKDDKNENEEFKEIKEAKSFFECLEAGHSIMESYPRQCRVPDGETFTENIGNELEKDDLIRIDYPRPNQKIKSPLDISGQAKGSWFFEGDFPFILIDWDSSIIAQGYLTAQSDSMTEDFVEFKGQLNFEKPEGQKRGLLILIKDNPSGLPENDDALEIPVFFE